MNRRGHSLPELLVTLALFGLLSASSATVFRSHSLLVRRAIERAETADALRLAALVLGGEARWLRPGRDLLAVGEDSIALRAFRGTATVCRVAGPGILIVRYQGIREPNPAKDSVIVLFEDTTEVVAGLRSAVDASGACAPGPGEAVARWELDRVPPPGRILLLFESGSYFIAAAALRYRLGGEGRQPLTGERFDDRSSGFLPPADYAAWRLDARLTTRPAGELRERATVVVPLHMLNRWD